MYNITSFDRWQSSVDESSSLIVNIEENNPTMPSRVIRYLGLLDHKLTMVNRISSISRTCYFHLRRICQVKRCLNEQCINVLVEVLVISRSAYNCNAVLVGPKSTLQRRSLSRQYSTRQLASSKIFDLTITSHIPLQQLQ